MTQYYTLSDIFKHEDTTRHYCNSEGGFELLPPELIELASQEPNFDTDYAEYVIFRRLHQIAVYIDRQSMKKGYKLTLTDNQGLKRQRTTMQVKNTTKAAIKVMKTLYVET